MICASIIMPMYNAEATIAACLDALVAQQTESPFEIICVDNNSTDKTIARIPDAPQIKVIDEPKQGAYAARNTGARAANGDVLLFIDPDCIAEPDWLAAHLRTLARPNAAVSLGRVRHGQDRGTLGLLGEYDHARQVVSFRTRATNHYFGYTNNLAIARNAWQTIGPFAERQRGADTVLVQNAVNEYGPRGVQYQSRACVRHLEMDRIATFWKKMLIYGRSSRLFSDQATPKPPSWQIRMRARSLACDRAKVGMPGRIKLSAALGLGIIMWQWGYRCGLGVSRQDAAIAQDATRSTPNASPPTPKGVDA